MNSISRTLTMGFFLLVLLQLLSIAEASVQVVDMGRIYESRPDKYVGLQMRTGLEYPARLQFLSDNQYLCDNTKHWNVTVPSDGLPGEFVTKSAAMCYFLNVND